MSENKRMISDELLAAFLDGNTSAAETLSVLKAAEHDEELKAVISIAQEVDADLSHDASPQIGRASVGKEVC